MLTIGIVGGSGAETEKLLPLYQAHIDKWIGADAGAYALARAGLHMRAAVGDFDSVSDEEMALIESCTEEVKTFPPEKDASDIELAIESAEAEHPDKIIMFGVIGGRLDHELANLQLMYRLLRRGYHTAIVDQQNEITIAEPGEYEINNDEQFRYVSFLPFSETVKGLTLSGFQYPLDKAEIKWGQTLSISNQLDAQKGTYSFESGIVLVIKSRDSQGTP